MNKQVKSTIGLVGVKLGMSRLFREEGDSVPVTLIHARPNRVCQIKTNERDGYSAVQVASGERKPQRISKALRGHYAKAHIPIGRCLTEFHVAKERTQGLSSGDGLDVTQFVKGQRVDLTGRSKGRGFAGAIKRWNFSSQDASHGNSVSHRHLGSTGQCQFPGKVWKGKKMAGQYGNKRVTTMRLEVAAIDEENHLLMIKGAVPGAEGSRVIVRPSHKQRPVEMERVEKMRAAREEARARRREEAMTKEAIEARAADRGKMVAEKASAGEAGKEVKEEPAARTDGDKTEVEEMGEKTGAEEKRGRDGK